MTTNKGTKLFNRNKDNDIFTDIPDLSERIIMTTIKELVTSYRDELMSDLLLEAQEAY